MCSISDTLVKRSSQSTCTLPPKRSTVSIHRECTRPQSCRMHPDRRLFYFKTVPNQTHARELFATETHTNLTPHSKYPPKGPCPPCIKFEFQPTDMLHAPSSTCKAHQLFLRIWYCRLKSLACTMLAGGRHHNLRLVNASGLPVSPGTDGSSNMAIPPSSAAGSHCSAIVRSRTSVGKASTLR